MTISYNFIFCWHKAVWFSGKHLCVYSAVSRFGYRPGNGYYEWRFSCFSWTQSGKFWESTSILPRLFHFKLFPVHYSPFRLRSTVYGSLLKTSCYSYWEKLGTTAGGFLDQFSSAFFLLGLFQCGHNASPNLIPSFIARKNKTSSYCESREKLRALEAFHTMSPKTAKKRLFQLRSSFLFCFPVPWVELILQIVKINISMTSLLIQSYHEPRQLVHYCDWLPTESPGFRSRYGHNYVYSRSHRSCETQLTFLVYTRGYIRSKVAMTSF